MRRSLVSVALLLLAGCTTLPAPAPAPAPGVAYSWATFDRDRIMDSGASGLADRSSGRTLTIDDPVRIASISKLVVALTAVRLVEQGRLDLDRDVSDYLGWPLRNPAFPDRRITLRRLLSHTSSLTDEVDYAIPLGRTVRETLAEPRAFDSARAPGTYFRYANLNFPVIASVLERAAGERFDQLAHRLVLEPLGLDACFNWTTCSDFAVARAVVLYEPDGQVLRDDLRGSRPDCPVLVPEGTRCDLDGYVLGSNGALFSPQGGLRISVRDLTVLGRLVLNGGWHGGRRFLTYAGLRQLFTPQWRFDPRTNGGAGNGETDRGFYCAYGLAVQLLPVREPGCSDDLFGNGRQVAGHAGDAYGLRSGLWVDSESGVGIAYFATGNGDDPPRGRSAYRAVEEWLARKLRR